MTELQKLPIDSAKTETIKILKQHDTYQKSDKDNIIDYSDIGYHDIMD